MSEREMHSKQLRWSTPSYEVKEMSERTKMTPERLEDLKLMAPPDVFLGDAAA